jgi:carbon-monoxide dehydrogenase medium subunit
VKPAPFQYERPDTIEGVLATLNQYGEDSKILAGGQSLVAMMNTRVLQPRVVIDINRVPALDTLDVEDDTLVIGALVRHNEIAESSVVREVSPLLVETYPHVSHYPIRNRGTLAGNLAHADPASEMPAVMLVAEAALTLRSHDNTRTVQATDFFLGPFETAMRSDELLTEVRIPVAPDGQGWGFGEFRVQSAQGRFRASLGGYGDDSRRWQGRHRSSGVRWCRPLCQPDRRRRGTVDRRNPRC